MFSNSDAGDSRESLGEQGNQTSQSWRKSTLNIHWKDWCWSWNSKTLATWCKELIHWKRLWCWERLRVEEKGVIEDEMAGWHHELNGHEFEQTLGRWWRTGSPGIIHDSETEKHQFDRKVMFPVLGEMVLCRRCAMVSSSTLSSGHQRDMLWAFPPCGWDEPCCCGVSDSVGMLVSRTGSQPSFLQGPASCCGCCSTGWWGCCCCSVSQWWPTLCDPMDCTLPGTSAHGILQARILGWVARPSSRGSSWSRDWTLISDVSCIGRQVLTTRTAWEAREFSRCVHFKILNLALYFLLCQS